MQDGNWQYGQRHSERETELVPIQDHLLYLPKVPTHLLYLALPYTLERVKDTHKKKERH